MKQLLSIFIAVLVAITAFGQSSPPNKLRSNDSFTQVDNYLVAAKRLGIPSGPTPTLDASTTSENSTKLFYDTDDGLLMVYNVSTSTWSPVSSDVDLTNYYTRTQVDSAIAAEISTIPSPVWGNITGTLSAQTDLQDSLNAKVDTTAYGFGLSWNPTTQKMEWGEHLEAPGFSGGQYVVRVPEASVVGLGDINSSDASFLAVKMGGLSSTGLTVGDRSTAQNIGVAAENLGVQQIRFFSPNGNMTYGSDGVLNYSIDKSSSYTNRSVVDKAYVDDLVASITPSPLKITGNGGILRTSRTDYGIGQNAIDLSTNGQATDVGSVIVGGTQNSVTDNSAYGVIVGGAINTLTSSAQSSAVIAGQQNTATALRAVTLGGIGLRAELNNSVVVGSYNASLVNTTVFAVGGGSSEANRQTTYYITSTGNTVQNGSVTAGSFRLNNALNTAPASATATGTTGEIRITSDYIYVCIAPNTWVRAALTSW